MMVAVDVAQDDGSSFDVLSLLKEEEERQLQERQEHLVFEITVNSTEP